MFGVFSVNFFFAVRGCVRICSVTETSVYAWHLAKRNKNQKIGRRMSDGRIDTDTIWIKSHHTHTHHKHKTFSIVVFVDFTFLWRFIFQYRIFLLPISVEYKEKVKYFPKCCQIAGQTHHFSLTRTVYQHSFQWSAIEMNWNALFVNSGNYLNPNDIQLYVHMILSYIYHRS